MTQEFTWKLITILAIFVDDASDYRLGESYLKKERKDRGKSNCSARVTEGDNMTPSTGSDSGEGN